MKNLLSILTLCACWYSLNFAQGSWSQTTTTEFNSNINFNINTSNDDMKLTNDVGTGADGDLYVPTSGTVKTDLVKTYVTGNNPSGQNAIQVHSSTGFSIGEEVLIITMQDDNIDPNNNLTGQYEFKRISNLTATALLFQNNLVNTYNSSGKKHQVLKVPNYNNVTIDVGGILTCDDWDGTTGGVLILRAKGLVKILALGKIDVTGKGYRGGPSVTGTFAAGIQGESVLGIGIAGYTNNLNGGGGGYCGNYYQLAGGGGGAYADTGQTGQVCGYMSYGGQGGLAIGNVFVGKVFLGGGGGSGATDGYVSASAGKGGDGGGIIYISADSMSIVGYCLADGQAGDNYSIGPRAGGGGGGSGGTMYLISNKNLNLGNNFVTAIGGFGGIGTDPGCNNGGVGGNGRIRIDGSSITGTSNPPVGFSGISYAYLGTSTTQVITKPVDQFWGILNFNVDISSPGTAISVDVLNSADSVLLSAVPSGSNLNYLGLQQSINSIKLKVGLQNSFGNQTPILFDWTVEWTLTDVKDIHSSLPNNYSISQNYPNPFNPTTTIKYALPHSGNVSIKVYDILGREVAVLVDEFQQIGNYSVAFDASNLASGIYFYRMCAGSYVNTKKMMVIK